MSDLSDCASMPFRGRHRGVQAFRHVRTILNRNESSIVSDYSDHPDSLLTFHCSHVTNACGACVAGALCLSALWTSYSSLCGFVSSTSSCNISKFGLGSRCEAGFTQGLQAAPAVF